MVIVKVMLSEVSKNKQSRVAVNEDSLVKYRLVLYKDDYGDWIGFVLEYKSKAGHKHRRRLLLSLFEGHHEKDGKCLSLFG